MRNNKALRVILPAAALITGAGAVFLFVKRKAKKHRNVARVTLGMIAAMVILSAGFSITAYAQASPPPETAAPTITAPATTTSTPASVPTSQPSTDTLTPNGDLTLVDDIQTGDKQIMTVVTKSGNYFYIVIDRSGKKENVYFLNLVDESDLMAIIDGKSNTNGTTGANSGSSTGSGAASVPPTTSGSPVIQQPTEQTPVTTTPPAKGGVNTGSIIIVVLLIAGAGGGIFYYFRILKPKQGAAKGGSMPELEEYDFEDENDGTVKDEEPAEQEAPDNATDNEQEDEDE